MIHLSRLRLANNLLRLVESLQGKVEAGKIRIVDQPVRGQSDTLPSNFQCLLVLALITIDHPQNVITRSVSWINLNMFPGRFRRFIQFPCHIRIVVGFDSELLYLAGVFPHLKRFGLVFAGASELAESGIDSAQIVVGDREGRIELDRSLIVRHSFGGSFFEFEPLSNAEDLQGVE